MHIVPACWRILFYLQLIFAETSLFRNTPAGESLLNISLIAASSIGPTNGIACTSVISSTAVGSWFYPSGGVVPKSSLSMFVMEDIVNSLNRIILYRNHYLSEEGIYTCKVGDKGSQHTLYLGLFNSTSGGECVKCSVLFVNICIHDILL